ncbi:thiamine pyrophosphate-dependent enzyme [Caballeronia sp. DA-9]|uniref:thiamine pyrophosphate-dependent enzyme n=1 Tax=Caballeronia sp. DA-9 TaxID=3436237 RepID=UPI003F679813
MIEKTTSMLIVDALVAHGVDTVFGIPGAHTYDFTDALYCRKSDIRFIHSRHEQGAGYMAYGYAKSSGRTGVFTVVPGPGVLNAGASLCTAYGANTPVMCITGNIMANLIGQGRGQLHELPDQLLTLRSITKWAQRINHPTEAANVTASAFHEMLSGRKRPVAIEVPWDVFGMKGADESTIVRPPVRPVLNENLIERAAQMIAQAKNPLIMVGGGAVDAGAEVLELARRIQAPVTSHRSGKGIVSDESPFAINAVAAYEYWRECDLLIGIGSRLELQFMRWHWKPEGLKVLRLDIDPTEMVRLKPDLGIVGDATEATAALNTALSESSTRGDRTGEFVELKRRARVRMESIQPEVAYLDAIRSVLPRDGFFVEEVCQAGFTARFAFPVYSPRHYVTCGYHDNLGFGFNTALGVKVANPTKAVVAIAGDGGFMFGVQELATAVQHGIAVVTVVFNNNSFGNVRRDQENTYHGRFIGADLVNPDFVALARSFGALGARVETPEALARVLEEMLGHNVPALIEVSIPIGSEASPWPLVHPAPHVKETLS